MPEDVPRPMRADARRNHEKIVATARELFATHGIDVPLDDIARAAKVGPGTLYRHFPSRAELIEAVYRGEISWLSARAFELLEELPPEQALIAWMREQVRFVIERSGLATTLKAAIDADSPTFAHCRAELSAAITAILGPAQAAGAVRADLQPADLMRLGHGIGDAATHVDEATRERLLSVLLAGLRA